MRVEKSRDQIRMGSWRCATYTLQFLISFAVFYMQWSSFTFLFFPFSVAYVRLPLLYLLHEW